MVRLVACAKQIYPTFTFKQIASPQSYNKHLQYFFFYIVEVDYTIVRKSGKKQQTEAQQTMPGGPSYSFTI